MLGLLHTKSDLEKNLSKYFDVCVLDKHHVVGSNYIEDKKFPDLDGLFIDWISNRNEFEFAHQAVIIENYIKKGIPTILFDRYLSLTHKEYNWLRKFNITFLEPAVCHRAGFEYFPFWTEPLQPFNYLAEDKSRNINLAYKGDLSNRIESFEKYYKEYARLYPEKKVAVETIPETLAHKIDEWTNYNLLFQNINFNDAYFTMLIGSRKEYQIGYLREDVFDIMRAGCIPILPIEHRWYSSAFDVILFDDLDYILSGWIKIRKVIIEEKFAEIMRVFPEMAISTAVERLKMWFTI